MELHIYKTEKAPKSGRVVKLDELECTYNLKDSFVPSAQLVSDVLKLFPRSEIQKIINTVMGIITIMAKTGTLNVSKENKDVNLDLAMFFNEDNVQYSKMATEAFLDLIQTNFDKCIDACQLILEQQRIYLTRDQVSAIEPQELAKVFLSLFRFLLYISKKVK